MSSAPRIVAGRFEVGELIGRGGMGEVYRGQDRQTGQAVAIKLLRADAMSQAPGAVERFRREGEALRRLNHPNIVKMLATIEEGDHHYIAMEYVEGGSLRDLLDRQPQLPVPQVLDIALDLADALTRAHRLNIIHRDLKPANVLLAEDGTPRLTDFGISQIGDRPRITQTGAVVGTDAYLSPEACRGAELDARTDIWSFGAMLFEMLAGRPLYDEPQTVAMLFAILTKPLPNLLDFRSDVPPELVSLIYSMLEKDRTQRIPSVRRVGSEIEAIMRGTSNLGAPAPGSRFVTPSHPEPSLHPHNLPTQATPFIGRREELDEIALLMQSDACRLLTLLGPGGSGKTRLGIQAALEQIEYFQHGVYFVPLAPLTSPDSIIPTLAEAMKFSFSGPSDNRQQLLDYLCEKNILLLMDNLEHVITGADLLVDILDHAPGVKILVTSRERLNVQQEWVLVLQGMTYPEHHRVEHFEQFSAVQLFLQSMHRAQAGSTLAEEDKSYVQRICQLVEGMPLGIELAAAWVRTLSLREIADEIERNIDFLATFMRNVPERQRSMRAVFDYSWHLLSPPERHVLQRLSVFRGGFWRDAAIQVAEASLPLLTALLDKSLLRRNPVGRYEVHELLRQYAAAHLNENPQIRDETRDKHAAYFMEFLYQRAPRLKGGRGQRETLEEIREEIENIRSAWSWAAERGQMADLEKGLDGLTRFYDMRSWFQEGCEIMSRTAERLRASEADPVLVARVLIRSGELCHHLSFYTEARERLEMALDILKPLNERREMAQAYFALGTVAYLMGDHQEAADYLRESLSLYRQLGDQWGIARVLGIQGVEAHALGDYEQAKQDLQDSLSLIRDLDDRWGTARLLNMLSVVAAKRGEYDEARQLGQESLAICRSIGDTRGISFALGNLGVISAIRGDYHEAKQLYQESLHIRRENGDRRGVVFSLTDLGDIDCKISACDSARQYYVEALRIAGDIRAMALVLWVLVRFAHLWEQEGEPERAAEILGLIMNHHTVSRETWDMAQRVLDDLRHQQGADVLHAAQERGKALSVDMVVDTILKEG